MHSTPHASGFVELLARSSFSFLRGASQPEELLREAKTKGLHGLGLCDLNGIYGSVRAWKASGNVSSKPLNQPKTSSISTEKFQSIVGAELCLTAELQARWPDAEASPAIVDAEEGRALSVALLVENTKGYENLCRLLTLSHAGRPKGQSACDPFFFERHHEGLSALIITPHDPSKLAAEVELPKVLELLSRCFAGRLSLATYRYLDGLDRVRTRWAQKWAHAFQLPIVATARPLYHQAQRRNLADVLFCIRSGKTLSEAGQGLSSNREAFLRSEAEMLSLFEDYPQWVHASKAIAARLQFDFTQLHYHFPCKLEAGQSADQRLEQLTWEGVGRRYPGGISQQLRAQLSKELKLIQKLKLAPYFLSTYDIVEIARRKKILCQGRGSAANSAVCYVLGITAVDPSRSHLLFERFLSEERNEPPDIDVDFEHERREEVIQEIYAQYGRSHAAMVCEIIRFRRKSALREVGKAFGFSQEQLSRLSDSICWHEKSEEQEKRLQEQGFDLKDPRLAQVYTLAEELIGFPRHLSIHVGGFVLSSRPLYEVAPIEPARMQGRTVIPWDKDDIDALGFFKVDVLALGMLSAIRKSLLLIHQDGGLQGGFLNNAGTSALAETSAPDFDPLEVITRIPSEDQATYDMICRADTVGVFQIESRAQMAMLPRLRPRRFYDLVIEVAIVRPGPIQGGMVHPYLRRRNQEEKVTCPHVELWPILERTLGVPLFQEQVMQLAIVGAGYSGGEADQLRRDMAAWKEQGRLLSHSQKLMDGFQKKGISASFSAALFEQIKGFGEYGFPESHSASFALLVYASAWLKCHYPAHFTCSLLNSQPMGFYQPTTLTRDAQKHGVEVKDLCILHSDWDCTLEEAGARNQISSTAPGAARSLRLGLRLVKGLRQASARRIIEARPSLAAEKEGGFTLEQLQRRCRLQKDEVQLLAEAGALEGLIKGRRQALWQSQAPRTEGLFKDCAVQEPQLLLEELRPVEQLVLDYERKGLSVSDHPLRYYRKRLMKLGALRAADLLYLPREQPVSLAGLVMSRQRPATASGVVFITLEDETGSINLIVYSSIFERYQQVARHSQLLFISGTIERDAQLPLPKAGEKQLQVKGTPITPVVHVVVQHLENLQLLFSSRKSTSGPALRSKSRNFH